MQPDTPQLPSEKPRRVQFSFFWPVVLIAVGIALLLSNFNVLPGNAWDWIMRLWPLIFIAWGLDGLLRREFVGATLMLGLGIIFLLSTLGVFTVNVLDLLLRLWPIFLISAGLGLLLDRRGPGGVGSIIGALVVLTVLAVSMWLIGNPVQGLQVAAGQRVVQALDGADKAQVNLEPPVGYLRLTALHDSANLLEGNIALQGNEEVASDFSVSGGTAILRLKGESVFVGLGPTSGRSRAWEVQLNGDVPTDLNVNMGVGEVELDLSELNLTNVHVNMAMGSVKVVLPQNKSLSMTLSGAMQSITLVAPPSTGVRIHLRGGLTAATMPPGYTQDGKIYQSPNYDTSAQKIEVYASQALGTLTVQEQVGR